MKPPPSARLIRGHRLAQGLVFFPPFNENGGLQVFDASEFGNTGSFQGTALSWTAGKYGSALNFPGAADDYVDCGTGLGNFLGSSNKNISVSIWFKTDITNSNDGLFNIGTLSFSQGEISLIVVSNLIIFRLNNSGLNESIAFTDTTSWHHVLVTYDGIR